MNENDDDIFTPYQPKSLSELLTPKAELSLPFNITETLVDVKAPVAVAYSTQLTWDKLCAYFLRRMSVRAPTKDGNGFNCNLFSPIKRDKLEQAILAKINQMWKLANNEKRKAFLDRVYTNKPEWYVLQRLKSYVTHYTYIALDFDNVVPPFITPQSIYDLLKPFNMSYIMYNSYSSSEEKPKFRLVIPLSEPISKSDAYYHALYATVLRLLDPTGAHLITGRIDPTSTHYWRFFYLPNYPESAPHEYSPVPDAKLPWIVIKKGDFLDPRKANLEYNLLKLNHFSVLIDKN